MDKNEQLQAIPITRIKPIDGMAVTADVWETAHTYHLQSQRAHAMLFHGAGIVTGLEVIASDPPDTAVYILPGVAVDAAGRTIVLTQPVAYDIGQEMEGALTLLLSYSESRPKADESQPDGPLTVRAEFSLAARTTSAGMAGVELARVQRQGREAPFRDAANSAQPGPNEIDLRFRREIGAPREISIAVCFVGTVTEKKHGRGATFLAQSLNRLDRYFVTVEDDARLAPGVEANTLIYLVGQGAFELSAGQINGLKNYVHKGKGTLFLESSDAASHKAFLTLLEAMELKPEPVQAGHSLLTTPHLFAAPPSGHKGAANVMVASGAVLSDANYGLVWQGDVEGGTPSREHLRAATEWGQNLLAYAWDRFRRR